MWAPLRSFRLPGPPAYRKDPVWSWAWRTNLKDGSLRRKCWFFFTQGCGFVRCLLRGRRSLISRERNPVPTPNVLPSKIGVAFVAALPRRCVGELCGGMGVRAFGSGRTRTSQLISSFFTIDGRVPGILHQRRAGIDLPLLRPERLTQPIGQAI